MKFLMLIVLAWALATTVSARLVPNWPYDKLFAKADLVVIAEAITNRVSSDKLEQGHDPKDYTGINTDFVVSQELKPGKSAPTITNLTVLHFRYSERVKGLDNGAFFIHFRTKNQNLQRTERVMRPPGEVQEAPIKSMIVNSKPAYLLFLKRRPDGRYEPLTGQYDATLSVREITQPSPHGLGGNEPE